MSMGIHGVTACLVIIGKNAIRHKYHRPVRPPHGRSRKRHTVDEARQVPHFYFTARAKRFGKDKKESHCYIFKLPNSVRETHVKKKTTAKE